MSEQPQPGSGQSEQPEDPWDLRAALDGDANAWAALVRQFSGTIWHWARRQGVSRDEAEDVCQNVWYKLKDRGHTIRDPRTLPGWLATTTRREAQQVQRKRARQGDLAATDDGYELAIPDAGEGPDDLAVAGDLKARLVAAFAQLGAACRQLLSLCWDGRLSYAEIAEAIERPIGAIGPTRQRCLRDLRLKAGLL